MAKDLPYFKFFCSEWNDGDITLEDYKTQGVFINVCSYYWSNECELKKEKLMRKFTKNEKEVKKLIQNGLIKEIKDFVKINFLDEQKEQREDQYEVKSKGGKASAEARRLKKIEQELNRSSTKIEHVLNLSSTESQVLREEKKREEKKRKDKIRESTKSIILNSFGWLEQLLMKRKLDLERGKIYLYTFLDFQEDLVGEGNGLNRDIHEIQNHFVKWLDSEIKKEATKKTRKPSDNLTF